MAVPSVAILSKMALLFGVTSDYLLGLDNRKVIVPDGLTDREAGFLQDIVNMLVTELRSHR